MPMRCRAFLPPRRVPAWVLRDTYFGCRPRPFRRSAPSTRCDGVGFRGRTHGRLCALVDAGVLQRMDRHTLRSGCEEPLGLGDRPRPAHGIGDPCGVRLAGRFGSCTTLAPDIGPQPAQTCCSPPYRRAHVWLVDFDRPCLSGGAHRANLLRLERSARKLDPRGQWVTRRISPTCMPGMREPRHDDATGAAHPDRPARAIGDVTLALRC